MKYMGSKNRIAKYILPIILADRQDGQAYVEPFVGGANSIDKVDGWRIGADSHKYLIAFLDAFVKGWEPPSEFTEAEYKALRDNKDDDPALTGYAGFCFSYGGKWFGGWARDSKGKRNYVDEAYRHMLKQRSSIVGVQFVHSAYRDLLIPSESIVYCDPPYANSTKYKSEFDHDDFWEWTRSLADDGHTVFVSEYEGPDYAECVWQKEQTSSLTQDTGSKRAVEKLFRIKPRLSMWSDGMLSHDGIMDTLIYSGGSA